MSITYLGAIAQFLVVLNLLSQNEADILVEGLTGLVSLIVLVITLWGRFRTSTVITWFGARK